MCWRPETGMIHELRKKGKKVKVGIRKYICTHKETRPSPPTSCQRPHFPRSRPRLRPRGHEDKTPSHSGCGATNINPAHYAANDSVIARRQRRFLPRSWSQRLGGVMSSTTHEDSFIHSPCRGQTFTEGLALIWIRSRRRGLLEATGKGGHSFQIGRLFPAHVSARSYVEKLLLLLWPDVIKSI